MFKILFLTFIAVIASSTAMPNQCQQIEAKADNCFSQVLVLGDQNYQHPSQMGDVAAHCM